MMRALAAVLIALVLLLQYRLWIAPGGMREVWSLRKEVTAQREENARLQERNRTLAAEVQDLKKGKAAIEERARTDLGMVGRSETFFQVVTAGSKTSSPARVDGDAAQAKADHPP